jgi:hypothetical protein
VRKRREGILDCLHCSTRHPTAFRLGLALHPMYVMSFPLKLLDVKCEGCRRLEGPHAHCLVFACNNAHTRHKVSGHAHRAESHQTCTSSGVLQGYLYIAQKEYII